MFPNTFEESRTINVTSRWDTNIYNNQLSPVKVKLLKNYVRDVIRNLILLVCLSWHVIVGTYVMIYSGDNTQVL